MSHALLPPSAAHRWLNCTISAHLEKTLPDEESPFMAEGTLAHAKCALLLKKALGLPTDAEGNEIEKLKELETAEMNEHVQTYVNIILEKWYKAKETTPDARLLVERSLDLTDYIPDGYGTADAIIVTDGVMEVVDFKYGKGVPVSAKDNAQMKIYALGAYLDYSMEFDVTEVRMTIVQPRCNNMSSERIDISDLQVWGDSILRPQAVTAYAGKGDAKVGSWCRFCRAKCICRQLADKSRDAVETYKDPYLLTNEELATDVLPMLETVQLWVKAVETMALERAKSGEKIPGYKLVASRGRRKVSDEQGLTAWLALHGFNPDDFTEDPKLKSLTELERLVGRKRFAEECAEFVVKTEGAPKLVAETTAGDPIDPTADFD